MGYIGFAKKRTGRRDNQQRRENMFDIMKVGKTIKEARIARDMTQMNLADAMEVSYQAVSNWERGNSMPDISKLEQLCQILQISIDQLLGAGDETRTITRIIHQEENDASVSMEEIGEIAPLLTPKEVKRLVHVNRREDAGQEDKAKGDAASAQDNASKTGNEKKRMDQSVIKKFAPFLDEEDLDELLQDLEEEMDMKTLTGLAPFLSQHSVDGLALRLMDRNGMESIMSLAPFLSQECLEEVLGRCEDDVYMDQVMALAPFLSSTFLKGMIRRARN